MAAWDDNGAGFYTRQVADRMMVAMYAAQDDPEAYLGSRLPAPGRPAAGPVVNHNVCRPVADTELSNPSEMERKHVHDVYEQIAPHFSNTRYKPWPRVAEYLEGLPIGSLNCDVGCGNGKYLGCAKDHVISIGTDRSFNLCSIANE